MVAFKSSLLDFFTRRPLWLMQVAIGLACVLAVGLMWRSMVVTHAAAEEDEAERIRVQANVHVQAAAATVQATLDSFDFALRTARKAVLTDSPDALSLVGATVADSLPKDLVIQLFYIDAQGYLSYSSLGPAPPTFLADRDYFKEVADIDVDRMVISDVVFGRLSNKWSIQFARGVRDAAGEFKGVVALAVSPETWVLKLKSFEVASSDVFAVLGANGAYLLRTLYGDGYYGKRVPADRPFMQYPEQVHGDFVTPGAIDGVARQFSWVRLPSGLVVVMGIGLDQALAPIRGLKQKSILTTLLLSSLLVLASGALLYALGRYGKVVDKSHEREEQYRSVLENMGEGIMTVDDHDRITGINPAFTALTGYGLDEVLGRSPALLSPRAPGARNLGLLMERYPSGRWEDDFDGIRWNGETYTGRATVSVVRGVDGQMKDRIVVIADVTEKRRKDEEIWRQANFDTLTGLPNRDLMADRLERMISHARRQHSSVAVLFVDLDRFKPVNDNYGHDVGDRLLFEVARRLESLFRDEDTVSRLGGDEFVVLLPRNDEKNAIESSASKVVETLSRPFQIDEREIVISCSVGIARFPEDGESAAVLLHKADVAMYRAKESGRASWSSSSI